MGQWEAWQAHQEATRKFSRSFEDEFNAGWHAAELTFAERVRLAQEQAWSEGFDRGHYLGDEERTCDCKRNPYTQGDKQA